VETARLLHLPNPIQLDGLRRPVFEFYHSADGDHLRGERQLALTLALAVQTKLDERERIVDASGLLSVLEGGLHLQHSVVNGSERFSTSLQTGDPSLSVYLLRRAQRRDLHDVQPPRLRERSALLAEVVLEPDADVPRPGEIVAKHPQLRRFANQPVAEIVQCGEPAQ
jgi:hypothetical protein